MTIQNKQKLWSSINKNKVLKANNKGASPFKRINELHDELQFTAIDRWVNIFADNSDIDSSCSSTVIHGETKWRSCWRHACYLAQYIYQDPPPADGFKTRFPEKMAEVEEHWEVWQDPSTGNGELNDQEESGLVARLFKVKGDDPNATLDPDLCPPTLVFRGTDFDDFRNVAIYISRSVQQTHTPLYTIRTRQPKVLKSANNHIFVLDKAFSSDTGEAEEIKYNLTQAGYKITRLLHEEIDKTEYEHSPSITHGGDGLAAKQIDTHATLTIELLTKEEGDWANNIRQGLGLSSLQYQEAINFTKNAVQEEIIPSKYKQLELTGHSLGGGLASAACAALNRTFSDPKLPEEKKVKLHAIVFNPAGVHPNTIAPASVFDGDIRAFVVKDEVLTTLQSFSGQVPLVDSLFKFFQKHTGISSLPESLGCMKRLRGISPGKANESWNVPAKGLPLPNLFPLAKQSFLKPPVTRFKELEKLDAALSKATSLMDFGRELVLSKLFELDVLWILFSSWFVTKFTSESFVSRSLKNAHKDELGKEIEALIKIISASVDYHGMDYVIATYDYYYNQDAKNKDDLLKITKLFQEKTNKDYDSETNYLK